MKGRTPGTTPGPLALVLTRADASYLGPLTYHAYEDAQSSASPRRGHESSGPLTL